MNQRMSEVCLEHEGWELVFRLQYKEQLHYHVAFV